MPKIDHIVYLLAALVLVLSAYIVLVLVHGTNPKLMDGVLILVGAVAAAARPTS